MIFRNHQKTFGIAAIIVILFITLFSAIPQKANATVPVQGEEAENSLSSIDSNIQTIQKDTATIKDNTGDKKSTIFKEMQAIRKKTVNGGSSPGYTVGDLTSWDSIAYIAAGVVLNAVTKGVVNWIKNGFEGQPGFITNYDQYLKEAFDQASGVFFKEFLSSGMQNAICSPFRAQLNLALKTQTTFQQKMTCTLSSVMKNATNLSQGIREGGWDTWLSVTMNPQNNPYGALEIASQQLDATRAQGTTKAQTESIFNKGFLSQKECVEETCEIKGIDANGKEYCISKKCVNYTTTSPGSWVESQLSTATGIDMHRLAVADSINEILSALISQLLKGLLK